MKITFLGTAAAEGIPALWCECPVCAKALRDGGKELRRRCSYLIDDDTMVDFGPDAFWQTAEFGIDLVHLKRIIFTHPHEDHLNPVDFFWRHAGYSQVTRTLDLYGSYSIFTALLAPVATLGVTYDYRELHIAPHVLAHFERVSAGDIEILPLRANHAPGRNAQILVLSRKRRTVLIANDTGWLPEESWAALRGVKLDAAVIENTCGLRYPEEDRGHMGCHVAVRFRDELVKLGCLAPDAPVVVNHFSHNGGANHRELEEFFAPYGIDTAFAGKVLEV